MPISIHTCASSGWTNDTLALRSKNSSGSSKMSVVHVASSAGERKISGSRQGYSHMHVVDITILTAETCR